MNKNYFFLFIVCLSLVALHATIKKEQNKSMTIQKSQTHLDDPVIEALAEHSCVVVQFYRPGCPYCVYLQPLFKALKQETDTDIHFIEVNIASNTAYYKSTNGFPTVPTVIYFKDDQEIMRHGSENATVTKMAMKKNISKLIC